jgi:hypothetical protein
MRRIQAAGMMVGTLAALTLGVSSASAAVTVTSFTASPSTTVAAAHPNVTTAFAFSYSAGSDDVKSTTVALPAGLVGNPNAAAKCTSAQLAADACPATSKIGTVSTAAKQDLLPLLPAITATGDVYNVTPTGTEPARVGMVIRPLGGLLGKFALSGAATVRVPGDYGLTVTFDNLPRALPALSGALPIPVQIQSISLTLNGLVAGGTKAFLTNPTSCGAATTTATATSYASATPSARTSSFTPTDCAHVPFEPGVAFAANAPKAGGVESLIAATTLPATELPRSQAHIRTTDVYLPNGTGINFAAIANITPCTDAQFAVGSAAAPACPASSQVGAAVLVSPLVGTTVGKVFFAQGTATAPLRQFISAQITPTQTAKFVAVNTLRPDGFIQTTLSNLPQTPVTTFALGFPGGPNGLLTAPAQCGVHYGAGVFSGWNGGFVPRIATQNVTSTATGSPCPATAAAAGLAPALPTDLGRMRPAVSRRPVAGRIQALLAPRLRALGTRMAHRR